MDFKILAVVLLSVCVIRSRAAVNMEIVELLEKAVEEMVRIEKNTSPNDFGFGPCAEGAKHIVEAILKCESEAAMSGSRPTGDSAQDALNSYHFCATKEIKALARAALAQNVALEECRSRPENLAIECEAFLAGLEDGTLCPEVEHVVNCPFEEQECCGKVLTERTITGACNNLLHPLAGASMQPHTRILHPEYDDCIGSPRELNTVGASLPSARLVSNNIFTSATPPSSNIATQLHVFYGQLTDHDLVETPIATHENAFSGELSAIECGLDGCQTDGVENRECFPIINPAGDPLFSNPLQPCMMFVRAEAIPNENCAVGPRAQSNFVTSFMDASMVYGSEDEMAEELRSFVNGRLIVTPHPFNSAFEPLLPTVEVDEVMTCRNTTDVIQCFKAGDIRSNDFVGLTTLHTIFVRYHNWIADELLTNHPALTDEEIYQQARKIVIAVHQNILQREYIPPILGVDWTAAFGLGVESSSYFTGYDETVAPGSTSELVGAALRFGHTQLPTTVKLSDPARQNTEDVFLTEMMFSPARVYISGISSGATEISGVNAVLIGLADSPASMVDNQFTNQIRGSLFTENPAFGQGLDLTALNIQRARDMGIPGYVHYRIWCNEILTGLGLTSFIQNIPANCNDFDAFLDNMTPETVENLRTTYNCVQDVDLFVGGMSEARIPGALVGPTFGCILGFDFRSKKFGDRFYFETSDQTLRFQNSQLNSIRNQTIASVMCQTLEDDDTPGSPLALSFQPFAFLQPRAEAVASLTAAGVSAAEIAKYVQLYDAAGRGKTDNVRALCANHPVLAMRVF